MKTIFTLLTASMVTVSAFAADIKKSGTLTVRSTDQSTIRIDVDGKRFEPNSNTVSISGLSDGVHNVRIYKQAASSYYNMKQARFDLVYSTTVQLKRKTNMDLAINRNNQVTIKETRVVNQGRPSNQDRPTNQDYGYDNDGQWDGYDNGETYTSTMNNRDFGRVLAAIDKEWLESNKIKSATQVVKTNALTTTQVTELVRLFSFDNNKLELAKQAYQNTVDKTNYYQVINLLSFNANKIELEKFIRNYR